MALNPIDGSPDVDDITGTTGDDLIRADAGNDKVDASDGNDIVLGQDGDDHLSGGYGDDHLRGGAGADILEGSYGNDWIYGGAGNDFIMAGSPTYSPEIDHVWGGAGDDVVHVWMRNGGEVHGDGGFDRLDLFWYDNFAGGADVTVTLTGPDAGAFTAGTSLAIDGFEALNVQTYTGNDTITGGDFGDDISVNAGANTVNGLGGDDRITFASGQANHIDGGEGTDVVRIVASYGSLVVSVTGTSASDNFGSVISHVENYEVIGAASADEARFDGGDDLFRGGRGSDLAEGNGGKDWLNGQGGDDTLSGGDGDDRLAGANGDDSLDGGNGHDILSGGLGADQLTGGDGADYFRFTLFSEDIDTIADMEAGTDRIQIASNAIAGALSKGQLSAANFSLDSVNGDQPQFMYSKDGANGHLYWYAAGSLLEIATLTGGPNIGAQDIYII